MQIELVSCTFLISVSCTLFDLTNSLNRLSIVLLGVRLFEQRWPELVVSRRVDEFQAAIDRRQPVVNDDVDPATVLPQLEVKDAGVVLDEQVVQRYDTIEEGSVPGCAQRGCRRKEPTVTCTS